MSDLFWLSDAQIDCLEPYLADYPKSIGSHESEIIRLTASKQPQKTLGKTQVSVARSNERLLPENEWSVLVEPFSDQSIKVHQQTFSGLTASGSG
jgi:hypothetical protein